MATKYSEDMYEISFSDKVSKQAYLKACKWLAINIYSKDELSDYITVQIKKNKERQLPTFTVKLFITVNEYELQRNYCDKCQQMHTLFYSVDKPNCDTCKMHGYRKQLHDNVKNMVEFWKEALNSENDF